MSDVIVKSKIKSLAPDMQVSEEVAEALNNKVTKIMEEASNRAKLNGRRTIFARDL